MINLELNSKHEETRLQLREVAKHMMRPYSRKYDKAEHSDPVELQEVGVRISPDDALMRECGQCLLEALKLGRMVRHRGGDCRPCEFLCYPSVAVTPS